MESKILRPNKQFIKLSIKYFHFSLLEYEMWMRMLFDY